MFPQEASISQHHAGAHDCTKSAALDGIAHTFLLSQSNHLVSYLYTNQAALMCSASYAGVEASVRNHTFATSRPDITNLVPRTVQGRDNMYTRVKCMRGDNEVPKSPFPGEGATLF